MEQCTVPKPASPLDYKWELYNLKEDFTQSKDLSKQYPEKLAAMQKLFMDEAAKNKVLPLDDRYIERGMPENRPHHNVGRTSYTYYDGTTRITEGMAPNMKNTSYSITADVVIPEGGANGIIMTQGGFFGGNAFLLLDGKPTFLYARTLNPDQKFKVQSPNKLAAGKHTLKADFVYDGNGPGKNGVPTLADMGKGGTTTIYVDGKEVAKGRIGGTVPGKVSMDETLDIGEDTGTPITREYKVPFKFTGELEKVVIDLK